ncbi:coiled-coil domain-containing protein [Streptomyces violascens]|uniref:hypothetical protein n=1 Tax=Streptomyces violascens TaxID=67381 RepID=UPI0036872CC4
MDAPKELEPQVAYAAALREALAAFLAHGGTQREVAQAGHIAAATLSRYLSGERVAPRTFLTFLQGFLAERGHPLPGDTYTRIDALCTEAHTSSGSPAVQLAELKEELKRIQDEQQQARRVSDERLATLEDRADHLAGELEIALERARAAEIDRQDLLDHIRRQDDRLRHAQAYSRQTEKELAEQREQASELLREVEVLRTQNTRLIEQEQAPVTGRSPQTSSAALAVAQGERGIGRAEDAPSAPDLQLPSGPVFHPAHRTKEGELRGEAAPSTAASYALGKATGEAIGMVAAAPATWFVAAAALGVLLAHLLRDAPGPGTWKVLLVGATVLLPVNFSWRSHQKRIDRRIKNDEYTEYQPLRDTLVTIGVLGVTAFLGTVLAAMLRATPGPAVWNLILTGAIVLTLVWFLQDQSTTLMVLGLGPHYGLLEAGAPLVLGLGVGIPLYFDGDMPGALRAVTIVGLL